MMRFLIAGGATFCVDFGTLLFLTEAIHIHYLISAGAGFIAGTVFNYLVSIFWVFENRVIRHWVPELIIFSTIAIGALVLNQLFMWFFTEVVHVHYTVSKCFTIALIAVFTYIAKKVILFGADGGSKQSEKTA
ncbi:GtrA family protein [Thermoproteota archaeon]